ncbi:hypothetical protein AVEN_39481-1 [Araneus ventricosus]|uniref:Uncharacterized protein n=1 Tax=Araneus ventricosus TaxID=182803 RepID=A0A4Y2D989_ARAVE|nr:hypothetical protein AVEN_39481-1 [Araneus ventricosus]
MQKKMIFEKVYCTSRCQDITPGILQQGNGSAESNPVQNPVQNRLGVKSGDASGRVDAVRTSNMECLRMLLHHARGPTFFCDFKRHNHQELSTFREACEEKRTGR